MASGDTLCKFNAGSYIPASSNFPQFEMRGGATIVLSFDDSTDETCYFIDIMPGAYDDTSDIIAKIGAVHKTDGQTAETASFDISLARMEDDVDNVETLTFDTIETITLTTGTANDEIAYNTVTIDRANMDGIVKHEAFALKLTVDTSDGSITGDISFISLELYIA